MGMLCARGGGRVCNSVFDNALVLFQAKSIVEMCTVQPEELDYVDWDGTFDREWDSVWEIAVPSSRSLHLTVLPFLCDVGSALKSTPPKQQLKSLRKPTGPWPFVPCSRKSS